MAERAKHTTVKVRRAYEARAADDGVRVLVDRLWPRGLAKATADIDEWAKSVAPSSELRQWFGHDPAKFPEFRTRYLAELADDDHAAALDELVHLARHGRLTLVTATKDVEVSHAAVLVDVISHPAR